MSNALDTVVGTYTGDGTAGRAVNVGLDLTQGAVAVWVFPQATYDPIFRYSNAGLTGGAVMTGSLVLFTIVSTTGGIMTFTSTGFTVTNDGAHNCNPNVNAALYTYLVFRDVSPDNHLLRVGTYTGIGDSVISITVSTGSTTVTSSGAFSSTNVGQVVTYNSPTESHLFAGLLNNSNGVFDLPSTGNGLFNATFHANARQIVAGLPPQPDLTHLWVMGASGTVYCSTDLVAGDALDLAHEVSTFSNKVTVLRDNTVAGAGFQLGTDSLVNNNTATYVWMGLNLAASDLLNNFFQSFGISGSAWILPAGFTPTFAVARRHTTLQFGAIWRGPQHTGTDSTRLSDVNDRATTGITAMSTGSPAAMTFGSDLTNAAGDPIFGYGILTGGVPLIPPTPLVFTTPINTAAPITVTPGCSVSPVYALVTAPSHGTLVGTLPNVIYYPTPGYTGSDSFVYSTGCGGTPINTTVTITVLANNNANPC